jgi:hypothetical protein
MENDGANFSSSDAVPPLAESGPGTMSDATG